MKKLKSSLFVIGVIILFVVCILTHTTYAQYGLPFFNPLLFYGFNPYFCYAPQMPFGFYPPIIPAPIYYPSLLSPMMMPPARVGAATIIITNPTAGTASLSVINPTVAPVPTVAAPSPLLSVLAPLYASLLYESPLTSANPLLNAVLSTIFL